MITGNLSFDMDVLIRNLNEYLILRSVCEVVDISYLGPNGIIKLEIKNPHYQKPKTKMKAWITNKTGVVFFTDNDGIAGNPEYTRASWLDGEI